MPFGALAAGLGVAQAGIKSAGANAAASAANQAAQASLAFDKQVYNTASGQLAPAITQGNNAGTALGGLLGLNGDTAAANAFKNYLGSTNYQFLLDQGEQGQAFLNAPNLYSGATSKALTNYAHGMAGNALQGYEGILQQQQGLGVNAALDLGGIGNQNAALQQSARQYGANATGAADVGNANAFSGALGNIGQLLGQFNTQSSFGGSSATSPLTSSSGVDAFGNPIITQAARI